MNKEFIPYEQSLEIRQLGFKEECLGVWQNLESGKNLVVDEEYDRKYDIPVLGADIGAPLYQQSFRWFRDVHGLNGVIEGSKKHGFEWCIFPDLDYYMKPPNNFNTYEEAEMACLRRLIEVVKEKN